jgi:nucleoside-diphosphate-sugar epimerase
LTLPTRRFKRPRLLIIGCGDIGVRVVKLLRARWHVAALTSSPERCTELRAAGAQPFMGNLDNPATLARLSHWPHAVLHLAPPPTQGTTDPRTAHLLQVLARGAPKCVVYGSTSGVYGHCHGAWVDECRAVQPQTPRAKRRVDAEQQLRAFGRRFKTRVTLLRIPGIYASDRTGGHPRERLARGTPVLQAEIDVHTNHIHADDLARACVAALQRGLAQRVVNVCDDTQLKMGDYFDVAADLAGLPRPRRISWAEAQLELPPMQLSFMGESRRLSNQRLKRELRLELRYPTVVQGLGA